MRKTYIKIIDYFNFISSLYLWIQKMPLSSGDYSGQSSSCNALGDCWNVVICILTRAPLVLYTTVMAYKAKWYLPYLITQKVADVLNCVDLLKLLCWFPWRKGFLMWEVCSGWWWGMQTTAIRSCTVIVSHVRIPLRSAERNAKLLQRLSVPYLWVSRESCSSYLTKPMFLELKVANTKKLDHNLVWACVCVCGLLPMASRV